MEMTLLLIMCILFFGCACVFAVLYKKQQRENAQWIYKYRDEKAKVEKGEEEFAKLLNKSLIVIKSTLGGTGAHRVSSEESLILQLYLLMLSKFEMERGHDERSVEFTVADTSERYRDLDYRGFREERPAYHPFMKIMFRKDYVMLAGGFKQKNTEEGEFYYFSAYIHYGKEIPFVEADLPMMEIRHFSFPSAICREGRLSHPKTLEERPTPRLLAYFIQGMENIFEAEITYKPFLFTKEGYQSDDD